MEPSTATDWRKRASCRDVRQDMVVDESEPLGVQLAKKLCADCPVVAACLAAAEQLTTTLGTDYVQGVWGGLTLGERNTRVGLGIAARPCVQCGLDCVPIRYAEDRCRMCAPEVGVAYADYRPQIEAMLAADMTYEQVARRLRLKQHAVVAACSRWKLKQSVAARRGRRPVKECGTMSARDRHRQNGESWENCACKHASRKRDAERARTLQEVNMD